MPYTLASIPLPDLHWVDEFDHTSVVQALSRTESGLLIREESAIVAGRPITLEGRDDYGWASRSTVLALYALQQAANAAPMPLLLADGRSFNVAWRREGNAAPMSAQPIIGPVANPAADEAYSLTLRLVTV